MKLPATLRALQYRNFQLFFSGQLISLIGTWMQIVAQSWLVYRLTGSSVMLGAIGFCSQIPVFLLAPVGGIVADRYNRQKVVIATQTASMLLALALAVLTLSGTVRIPHIFILSALLGVVNAFDIPARQAFIVEMVGKPDLMNAIALNSSMFNASRVVGPAIAGILVARIGEGWCFFCNGVSYVAVIAGLMLMRVAPLTRDSSGSPLRNLVEGFRYVAGNLPVRALLGLLAVVSIAGMPYMVLMPIFADRILHGGAAALGSLLGATGIGALAGALMLASRRDLQGFGRGAAAAAALFGISLLGFSFSRTYGLSLGILAVAGFAVMVQMGTTNTLIQSVVPDPLRGRVMSIYSMMFMGMVPFGSLLAGWGADRFGSPTTVAAGGAISIAAAGAFTLFLPQVRVETRRLLRERQAAIYGN
jgi:MFS family permease